MSQPIFTTSRNSSSGVSTVFSTGPTPTMPHSPDLSPSPASSSPSGSPVATTGGWQLPERLNALLSSFEAGTHDFYRDHGVRMPENQSTLDPMPRRGSGPLLSLLSLTRPLSIPRSVSISGPSMPVPQSETILSKHVAQPQVHTQQQRQQPHRHFDPSREPKLHGLL